jgi:hypothetical protein
MKINNTNMVGKYRLKAKYDGILGVKNSEMTDKKAKELIKTHPRGEGLFAEIPQRKPKEDAEPDNLS